MLSILKDIFFPPLCVECKKMYTFLCPRCFNTCTFSAVAQSVSITEQVELPVHSCLTYSAATQSLVHTYKFLPVPDLCLPIAQLLIQASSVDWDQVDVITAVPLHPKRLAERGFNQSELLAEQLSILTDKKYLPLLSRTEYTAPQSSITDRTDRITRMKNQFKLRSDWQTVMTSTRSSILIIDDVFTTGSTLRACATELLKIKNIKLSALTIAHGI